MTDKEKKSKIADILMDFQEEYSNEVVNRPMIASLYAGNILSFIDSLQEEPVSKQIGDYDHKAVMESLHPELKEEPVSEELEYFALQYAGHHAPYDDCMQEVEDAIKAGAQWQKQKDDREIKMVRELLADFDKHCDEYHEAGFKHGQEALMKEAVNAKVHNNGIVVDSCDIASFLDKCNDGEEIKIIPIKEH